MATSHSAKEFADRLQRMATATETHQRKVVIDGAQETKKILLATAAGAGLKPGGKIAGKRWTVRYDLKQDDEALVRFTGPFHLVEGPTKPHEITPKAGRPQGKRSRGRGAKALLIGGSDVRATASHPGTRGKKVFARGKVIAHAKVPGVMAREQVKVWKSVIG